MKETKTMCRTVFQYACMNAGYCDMEDAKKWTDEHPKDFYTESDMIDVYHCYNQFDDDRHCSLDTSYIQYNGLDAWDYTNQDWRHIK